MPRQVHREVEARLPAERRQQRIGPFLLDHLGHDLPGDRLDVGAIRRRRIGHDRGRIRVHEHDLVTLFTQGFTRLRARVVELTRLANDNRPGTNDENLLEVVAAGHGGTKLAETMRVKSFQRTTLPSDASRYAR